MPIVSRDSLNDAIDSAMGALHVEICGVKVGLEDLQNVLTSAEHLPTLAIDVGATHVTISSQDGGAMANLEIKF